MTDPAPTHAPANDLRRPLLAAIRPEVAAGCLIIGEVAQAHDGSLGMAHSFIDAIAMAGADAVKFQTHIAAAESTVDEPWRVRFSPQDTSRFAYWQRMAFSTEQWRGLKLHAEQRGLLFLSSPFSPQAVDLLFEIDIAAFKVASGEALNPPLLERMLETAKPMLLSTGMSTLAEIDDAVARMRAAGVRHAVMQCTLAYPCPPERVGLALLEQFRQRYGCAVGLSDHSGTIFPGLAAATLGAEVLEVHVTFHRAMFGPDVPASVTLEELGQLVEGVRFIERMRSATVDKQARTEELDALRKTFGKSIVAARDLAAGTILGEDDLALKKPAGGLPPAALDATFGRRLRHAVARDQALTEDDLEAQVRG